MDGEAVRPAKRQMLSTASGDAAAALHQLGNPHLEQAASYAAYASSQPQALLPTYGGGSRGNHHGQNHLQDVVDPLLTTTSQHEPGISSGIIDPSSSNLPGMLGPDSGAAPMLNGASDGSSSQSPISGRTEDTEDRWRSINQMILNVKGRGSLHGPGGSPGGGGMFARDVQVDAGSRIYDLPGDDESKASNAKQKGKGAAESVAAAPVDASGPGGVNAKPPLPRGSACLICRKRKLRCDGQRPKCATCARLGHECGYGGQEGSMERLSEYASILEQKIRILETELTKSKEPGSGSFLSAASISNADGLPTVSIHAPPVQPPEELRSQISDALQAMLDAGAGQGRPDEAPDVWHTAEGINGLTPSWGLDLPPADTVNELMQLFFTTHNLCFPMIHRARFMMSLHHGGIRTKPSLALVYAMLAIAAPYHSEAAVRATSSGYYALARNHFESASSSIAGALGLGNWTAVGGTGPERVATVTVELVQACVVLACVEMGWSDHQRAFMTVGTAARLAAMLGLLRMDEGRISEFDGVRQHGILRAPALHPLPEERLLLEECRRTVWCVYVLDRFESVSCGWPQAIHEQDMRLLLPSLDDLFEDGSVGPQDNAHCWPPGAPDVDDISGRIGLARRTQGPNRLSPFAWLCRVSLLGSRLSLFHYRPMGMSLGGPLRPLELVCSKAVLTERDALEIEQALRWIMINVCIDTGSGSFENMAANDLSGLPTPPDSISSGTQRSSQQNDAATSYRGRPNLPVLMCELTSNFAIVGMHHLKILTEAETLSPATLIYSWKRCFEATRAIYDLAKGLLRHEAHTTRIWNTRVTPISILPPHMLFCFSFALRFLIGSWEDLQTSQIRFAQLNVPPVAKEEERVEMIETILEVMARIAERWPVAQRFIDLNRKGQAELYQRLADTAAGYPPTVPSEAFM